VGLGPTGDEIIEGVVPGMALGPLGVGPAEDVLGGGVAVLGGAGMLGVMLNVVWVRRPPWPYTLTVSVPASAEPGTKKVA
jgi:hypothetical protein